MEPIPSWEPLSSLDTERNHALPSSCMAPQAVAPTPAEVLATNVRRLREARGWRQADVAGLARTAGFPAWAEGTVAQIEAGTRRVTTDELFFLSLLLRAPLAELFWPTDPSPTAIVHVGDIPVPAGTLAASAGQLPNPTLVSRAARTVDPTLSATQVGIVLATLQETLPNALGAALLPSNFPADPTAAEEAELLAGVASRLRERPVDVAAVAGRLWNGRGIRAERERRLAAADGTGDPRVRRGHITRALIAELEQAFAEIERARRSTKRRSRR
jgi:transcriptional regulator with XRE-family HTH domain